MFGKAIFFLEYSHKLPCLQASVFDSEWIKSGMCGIKFFVQRKMGRGTTDITACTYGYDISSQLVSKKQAHQAKLQECLSLAANGHVALSTKRYLKILYPVQEN